MAPPAPHAIAANTSASGVPSAASAVPAASMTSEIWLMRKAPWRTMKLPHPSCATSEAAAVRPKYTPTHTASMRRSVMIAGAMTAGSALPSATKVCWKNIAPSAMYS